MTRRFLTLFAGSLALALAAGRAPAQSPPLAEPFRFAGSSASFGGLQRNDMTAALKAWTVAVTRDLRLDGRVQVEFFESCQDLVDALARGSVEAATMTAEEFVRSGARPEEIFVASRDGVFTKNYVILVRKDSAIDDLAALKGRELVVHNGLMAVAAIPWLETTLADRGLGRADSLLSRLYRLDNPSKCVLRVFFGQSAACLVGVQSFEVACELNPQLKAALRILETSQPLIPSFFFFRPDYRSSLRPKLEEALAQVHTSVAGQQLLMVYMATRLERHPIAHFDPTRRLIERYLRLTATSSPTPREGSPRSESSAAAQP